MADQKSTPREYGLKVRTLPGVLQITATNKLREAWPMELSYSGALVETYAFARDAERARANYTATCDLVRRLGAPKELNGQKHAWQGVSADQVVNYLRRFQTGRDIVSQTLLREYITAQQPAGHLTSWTVVLIEADKDKDADIRRFSFPINGSDVDVTATARTDATPQGVEYEVAKSHIISGRHEMLDFEQPDRDRALQLTLEILERRYQERLKRLKPDAPAPERPAEPARPSPAAIKAARVHSKALLLIYPLDPIDYKLKTLIRGFEETTPIMGYAISFPAIEGDHKVKYMVNTQFFNEFDYPDELDQPDADDDLTV